MSQTDSQSKERNGDEANILLALRASMTYYDENSFPVSGATPLTDYLAYAKKVYEAALRQAEADEIYLLSAAKAALEEETLP